MINYTCAPCKDSKTGWCKNWDGHCSKDDLEKGTLRAKAMECQLDPATCGFYVIGKVHQPEEVIDGKGNG
jgi:hypothetical protein